MSPRPIVAAPVTDLPVQREAGAAAPPRAFSVRRAARIAGLGYVLLFALAILANFGVKERLIVPDDAAATVANLSGSLGLFRGAVLALLAVVILDVVVAWALNIVFRQVHPELSLLAAWSRLVYTVFLGVALVFYLDALRLLGGAGHLDALGPDQLSAQVMRSLESFDDTWLIGLAVFGVHLLLLGALVLRSGLVSRVLGYLLLTAGAAYLLDTAAHIMMPGYQHVAPVFLAVVAVPSMVGEGWLALWLLRTRRLAR